MSDSLRHRAVFKKSDPCPARFRRWWDDPTVTMMMMRRRFGMGDKAIRTHAVKLNLNLRKAHAR